MKFYSVSHIRVSRQYSLVHQKTSFTCNTDNAATNLYLSSQAALLRRLKARNICSFFVSKDSFNFPNGVRMKIRLRLMAKYCRISLKDHTAATLFILIALDNSNLIVQFIAPLFQ